MPCDGGGDQGEGGHDGLGQGGKVGCPQAPAVVVVDRLGSDHKVGLGGHPQGVHQGGVGLPSPEEHLEHRGVHQRLSDVHWRALCYYLQSSQTLLKAVSKCEFSVKE